MAREEIQLRVGKRAEFDKSRFKQPCQEDETWDAVVAERPSLGGIHAIVAKTVRHHAPGFPGCSREPSEEQTLELIGALTKSGLVQIVGNKVSYNLGGEPSSRRSEVELPAQVKGDFSPG